MDTVDYKELAKALLEESGAQVRTKGVVSSTPTTTFGHGPGGLFSYPGMNRPVFSAMQLPFLGLQSMLPVLPTRDENPIYPIVTGVTATTGSEPDNVCDDPPTAGLTKLCTHTAPLGRMARQTRVFELTRMGRWTNRGEFGDYTVLNSPAFMSNPNKPTLPGNGNSLTAVMQNEVAKQMFEFGVAWARDFARDLYTANPANNTAGDPPGRAYYRGLDLLINTGRQDAITGIACPAADSIVRSFGNADISTNSTAQTNIVKQITNIYRNLRKIASDTGLDPVRWALVMKWELFYELTAVWPCAYQTYRCQTTGTNDRTLTDRNFMNAMTDGMRGDMYNRTGQYLLVDGVQIPVVLDDGIAETVVAGESFRSDMYFVPLTVLGGTPVTYFEHVDYDMPGGAMESSGVFAPPGFFMTSDNGRFLWVKKLPNNTCVQLYATTQPRLLLLTPQVAARLTGIQYTPLAHSRDYDPASSFFFDGGRTNLVGYGPSLYPPTA